MGKVNELICRHTTPQNAGTCHYQKHSRMTRKFGSKVKMLSYQSIIFFAILKRAKLEINKINTLDPAIWNCQGKRKVRNYGFMAYFSRRIILWLTFPKELTSHKRFFPPFFLSFSLKTSETRKS